ncbi:MAG TPA: glycosyltransferase family 9 protein [Acidobacteriaceae bacterium]|nr:glycosyltransferase family 9 protein [Acidobacteriaceae bacterium]
MSSSPQALRVLIVRLGAMGDILHALPAVTALRTSLRSSNTPAFLGWAIEPQWQPLLCAASSVEPVRGPQMPVIDTLHRVPAKDWARRPLSSATLHEVQAVRSGLRARRYDVCVDLQGALRSAWIGRMAAAPRLIGEANPREPLARWVFKERIETRGVHVIEQAREVVAAVLGKSLPGCAAELPIDSQAEQWCQDWLAERSITRYILMNPGAGWGAKRWPAARYAAVAAELARMGYATIVNVGPGEEQMVNAMSSAAPVSTFAMKGSIGQLIACTRRAQLFIGGDTGPLHLASALQVPVVGIYGPTDPARNGPFETRALVLRHPASKRDHSRKSEPEAGLLTITVADVLQAAQELLAEAENAE